MEHLGPQTYREFWPFYLREHSRRLTRILHLLGTLGGVALLAAALVLGDFRLAVLGLVLAYGLAWFAHFHIEKNRPATFRHPLWSLRADMAMVCLALTGRLDAELARHAASAGEARHDPSI